MCASGSSSVVSACDIIPVFVCPSLNTNAFHVDMRILQIISTSAVPLVKIVDSYTDIRVDISWNQHYGLQTAQLVKASET